MKFIIPLLLITSCLSAEPVDLCIAEAEDTRWYDDTGFSNLLDLFYSDRNDLKYFKEEECIYNLPEFHCTDIPDININFENDSTNGVVPEPTTLSLMALGLVAILIRKYK